MRSINRFFTLSVLLFAAFNFYTCKSKESPEPELPYYNNYSVPAVTFSASVSGFVEDENHQPVSGAVVSAGKSIATTDAQGYFFISKAYFTGDFCYIKATRKGFFAGSSTIHGKAGSKFAATLVMAHKTNVQAFNASQGAAINISGGAQASFPANAIQTIDGDVYNGKVNVSIAHLDPSSDNFSSLIPGGDLRAYSKEGKEVQLYSLGMLNVELEDEAGKPLQLAKGKQAQLTFPVPASMQADAPATIPLWYFDDIKGIWIEEGEATLQNGNYIGNVAHFTPWNCDKPFPPSILNLTIVNGKGDPISYAKVKIGQTNYTSDFKGNIQAKVVSNTTLDIDAYDEFNTLIGVNFQTPFLEGNKEYQLGNITVEPKNRSNILGVIKNCDGTPLNGYGYIKYKGQFNRFIITDSKLDIQVPSSGEEAEIYIYEGAQRAFAVFPITFPNTQTTVNWGEKKICQTFEGDINISFEYDINDGKGKQFVSYKYAPPYTALCRVAAPGTYGVTNMYFSDIEPEKSDPTQALYHFYFFINESGKGAYDLIEGPTFSRKTGYATLRFNDKGLILKSQKMEIVLTNFGSVGEFVKGSFSGTAIISGSNQQVSVTNGQFVVPRLADIP